MQYTAWPDHGVPDSPKHFIDFVAEVRRARNGSLDPIVVHCSAVCCINIHNKLFYFHHFYRVSVERGFLF